MSFIHWLFVTESVEVSVLKLVLTLGAVITGLMALVLALWHSDDREFDVAPLGSSTAGDCRPPRWLLAHSRQRR